MGNQQFACVLCYDESGTDGAGAGEPAYTQFEDLQLASVLGSGQFGEVKLAINRRTKDQFAVKVMQKARMGRRAQRAPRRGHHHEQDPPPAHHPLLRVRAGQAQLLHRDGVRRRRRALRAHRREGRLLEREARDPVYAARRAARGSTSARSRVFFPRTRPALSRPPPRRPCCRACTTCTRRHRAPRLKPENLPPRRARTTAVRRERPRPARSARGWNLARGWSSRAPRPSSRAARPSPRAARPSGEARGLGFACECAAGAHMNEPCGTPAYVAPGKIPNKEAYGLEAGPGPRRGSARAERLRRVGDEAQARLPATPPLPGLRVAARQTRSTCGASASSSSSCSAVTCCSTTWPTASRPCTTTSNTRATKPHGLGGSRRRQGLHRLAAPRRPREAHAGRRRAQPRLVHEDAPELASSDSRGAPPTSRTRCRQARYTVMAFPRTGRHMICSRPECHMQRGMALPLASAARIEQTAAPARSVRAASSNAAVAESPTPVFFKAVRSAASTAIIAHHIDD